MKAKKIAGQQPTEGSSKKISQSAVARPSCHYEALSSDVAQ
ncbi:MAG: hypothetical protein ACLROS_06400 [Faecalibacterium sp.]